MEFCPVDEVCWNISKEKIRISKFGLGSLGYMCWRKEKKKTTEDWIWRGSTDVLCRKLDNKLFVMLFPIRFA
jgi:hypothetical protein